MLKFVYSFFLGLLLVIFVGMGVATFYESPKAPEYPRVLQTDPGKFTAEEKRLIKSTKRRTSNIWNMLSIIIATLP